MESSGESKFDTNCVVEANEIARLRAAYFADTNRNKVDLIVGAYRDDNGKMWPLPVVRKVEEEIVQDMTQDYEYLRALGDESFTSAASRLLLGGESMAITEERVASIQSVSGTGALWIGAKYLSSVLNYNTFYININFADNHRSIFECSGLTDAREYRYWDPATRSIDMEGLLEDLRNAPKKSVIILQACSHNPTGLDPTRHQWSQIVDILEHANTVREAALQFLERRGGRSPRRPSLGAQCAPLLANMGRVKYRGTAQAGTFFARDNVSNFIAWCRQGLDIMECLLFETDDLCLRKNEKHVILCLLEVARRGARLGMPAPVLVQMEREIDRELAAEQRAMAPNNAGSDFSDEEDVTPISIPQIVTNDLKSLDEMTRRFKFHNKREKEREGFGNSVLLAPVLCGRVRSGAVNLPRIDCVGNPRHFLEEHPYSSGSHYAGKEYMEQRHSVTLIITRQTDSVILMLGHSVTLIITRTD
uniref:aspartate transaminase n=1 Tax=Timema genevievae TaxID=629358 RepID=A0A7R9JS23_TIMGE|nr:unnamed protein product [Timema genevievae]